MNNIKFKCILFNSEIEIEYFLNNLYKNYNIDKIIFLDIDTVSKKPYYMVKIVFTVTLV